MKALSLTEPWATLVATGEKKIETRSWKTPYRGLIAIHAAKNFPAWAKEAVGVSFFKVLEKHGIFSPSDFTLGAIIGVTEIKACLSTNGQARLQFSAGNIEIENGVVTKNEMSGVCYKKPLPGTAENCFGDYSANRFMWFLENPQRLKDPIPCRGALSLWDVPINIEQQIKAQLNKSRLSNSFAETASALDF